LAHPSERINGKASRLLSGRKIVLGVAGSVAAYRAPDIARELMRHGAKVVCAMSGGAEQFVGREVMHWATGSEVVDRLTGRTEHVEFFGKGVGGKADLLLIAPATSTIVAKIACGIGEGVIDLMAATALGSRTPVVIAPAMHEALAENPLYVENVAKLKKLGVVFVPPRTEDGKAKIAMPREIADYAIREIGKDAGRMKGKKTVVTAGATREFIDDVRFISNPGSGRMGVEIARRAWQMGAEAVVVAGHVDVEIPGFIEREDVGSLEEMRKAVLGREADAYFLAGAPGDFGVQKRFVGKMDSRRKTVVPLSPLPKIADDVKKRHPKAKLVLFKAESDAKMLEERAGARMRETCADVVVGNVVGKGRGFGDVESEVLMISARGKKKFSGTKAEIADGLLHFLLSSAK
jgi:phosphopantothenoylcysteine decarboxylase/phosphopantothenate--cysteine ligase